MLCEGVESALKKREADHLAEELKAAKQRISKLTMEVEILRKEKEIVLRRPLAGKKSRK